MQTLNLTFPQLLLYSQILLKTFTQKELTIYPDYLSAVQDELQSLQDNPELGYTILHAELLDKINDFIISNK